MVFSGYKTFTIRMHTAPACANPESIWWCFLIVIVNNTRGKEISATTIIQEIKRRGGNGRRNEDQGSAP
jgi:hypothetical protein